MKQKTDTIIILFGKQIVIPKSVVWGAFGTILITGLSFSYAFISTTSQTNKDVPTQDAKITSLLSKDSAKTLQLNDITHAVKDVDTKVNTVDDKVEKGFERIEKRLGEIYKNTK